MLVSTVGIVFGREESGLKNEELACCDIASTISLKSPYPSLNLAQTVMLYAYVFSDLGGTIKENKRKKESERLYHELKNNAIRILEKVNIDKDLVLHKRMIERLAAASEDDAKLFLSFAKYFNQLFE